MKIIATHEEICGLVQDLDDTFPEADLSPFTKILSKFKTTGQIKMTVMREDGSAGRSIELDLGE